MSTLSRPGAPGRVIRPRSLEALVGELSELGQATMVAGGTDLMVEVNDGRLRPANVIDLTSVPELQGWRREQGRLRLGALTTFGEVERELGGYVRALAQAARTVGSPQIRSRATIGGNLGTASPAGDALPVLIAASASIQLASVEGVRTVPARDYFLGPRRTVRRPEECVLGVELPEGDPGRQEFLKVGVRNSMVISVASVAVHLDAASGRVGVGLGSVGPRPLAATAAEAFASDRLAAGEFGGDDLEEFGGLVREAAEPIDDHRGTAAYRRHVVGVLAVRGLARLLEGTSA